MEIWVEILGKLIPIVFGLVAICFSFFAYRHTKELFRLELSEKRWKIYEETLKFCSGVIDAGGIPKYDEKNEEQNKRALNTLIAANEAFRSIGYHKVYALFGPEIREEFKKLNKAYATLSTGSEFDEKNYDVLKYIAGLLDRLPELFKPYFYFGDYKREIEFTCSCARKKISSVKGKCFCNFFKKCDSDE